MLPKCCRLQGSRTNKQMGNDLAEMILDTYPGVKLSKSKPQREINMLQVGSCQYSNLESF